MDDKKLTWDDVDRLVSKMVVHIDTFEPNVWKIVAVMRGGVYPAMMMAKKLGLPIDYIGVTSYREKEQGLISIYRDIDLEEDTRVMYVEDIVDTGLTAEYLLERELRDDEYVHLVSLVGRPDQHIDRVQSMWRTKGWVTFPWESG